MSKIEGVAILGTGVIGASWSALFLAAGFKVRACDPADSDGSRLRAYIDSAWPALSALEMTTNGNPDNITLHASATETRSSSSSCAAVRHSNPVLIKSEESHE
jgi:carnitine 3-dehydrogenase